MELNSDTLLVDEGVENLIKALDHLYLIKTQRLLSLQSM